MKNFKSIRGTLQKEINEENIIETETIGDPPSILILKRKYIRMFPGNVKVAIYWSDALQKHISIPYSDIQTESTNNQKPLGKEAPEPFNQDNLAILKNIAVTGKEGTLKFSDGTEYDVDVPEANEILSVYARCSPENQEKIETLLTKGVGGVMKLVKFCKMNQ